MGCYRRACRVERSRPAWSSAAVPRSGVRECHHVPGSLPNAGEGVSRRAVRAVGSPSWPSSARTRTGIETVWNNPSWRDRTCTGGAAPAVSAGLQSWRGARPRFVPIASTTWPDGSGASPTRWPPSPFPCGAGTVINSSWSAARAPACSCNRFRWARSRSQSFRSGKPREQTRLADAEARGGHRTPFALLNGASRQAPGRHARLDQTPPSPSRPSFSNVKTSRHVLSLLLPIRLPFTRSLTG